MKHKGINVLYMYSVHEGVISYFYLFLGKIDQSSAGAAYDSLVNQLLTLLDGLR